MPKIAKALTAIEVKRLEHPGHAGNAKFAVGGVPGLVLQITPTGGRSWLLRTIVGGRRKAIGLGNYPAVTLARAREKALEALDTIREGMDPVEKRKAARAALVAEQKGRMTFDEAVERFLATKLDEFKNARHRQTWGNSLRDYASDTIGDMPVGDIGVPEVLRTLEPRWRKTPETASRVRGRIEAVLNWATVAGYRKGENPARWKGNLDALLPNASKVKKGGHQPALALNDAARWFADLRQREGMAAKALELIALTAVRSGEARGAAWSEIDLDAALWTVPAERMKTGREHRVPLAKDAIVLLRDLPRMAESEFVFPNREGNMLSDMSVSAVLRRMQAAEEKVGRKGWLDPQSGRAAVPHGLRSTFRQWTAEQGYPRDMAEIALAHWIGPEQERAYQRSDMLDRRRDMMKAWAEFLRNEPGEAGDNVLVFGGAM